VHARGSHWCRGRSFSQSCAVAPTIKPLPQHTAAVTCPALLVAAPYRCPAPLHL
jgi:hypothetical protein